ncbi:uncharacterized protein LOC126669791 [Mercurialis annua]|uniref:uncharacterized protein LOC126669791 n=1 Tax=Mercurialis annua TaxID=3986 RepID=UPI00215E7C0F|nr:uncharacterized protein LOC126669791 [Mercurialis annua]
MLNIHFMAFRNCLQKSFGLVLVLLLSHVRKSCGGTVRNGAAVVSEAASSKSPIVVIIVAVIVGLCIGGSIIACIGRRTILTLQVGLKGEGRPSLQRLVDMSVMATNTATLEVEGWRHIMIETTNALLGYSQFILSASSSVEKYWCNSDVLNRFEEVPTKEYKKFDIESLNSATRHEHEDHYIVVTFLVAAKGGYKTPPIMKTIDDIKEALKFLIAVDSSDILNIQVLWTPQHENDILSKYELEGRFPHLKPINANAF